LEDRSLISLIICTRNRGTTLPACLDRVGELRGPLGGWELVVVDNGSTDETPAILEAYQARLPLIVGREERAGLTRARNRGVAIAQGDVLAFTDDDCYVSGGLLVQVEGRFADPTLGFLGGRIVLHDPSDAPLGITGLEQSRDFAPRSFVPPGLIQGSNFACRRRALDDVGGFDPGLGPGTPFNCEEVDCLDRISAAGWSGGFDPEIVVSHHHRRKPGSCDLRNLARSYAHGRGAYYAKSCLEGRRSRGEALMLGRSSCLGLISRDPTVPLIELWGGGHYLAHRLARATRRAISRLAGA